MEEKLSREEILSRSRQENRKGDERERTIRVEGESFRTSCVANRLYRLTQRKNTFDLVTLLLSLALLAWNLVKFFQMT